MMVCSEHAITEKAKPIGVLETGRYGQIKVVTGLLNLGESTGVPIIRQALKKAGDVTIIDCPTGSACSVMESMMDADYCILVAEPTAFGFHNFCVVYELTALLGKKCGVVINKQSEPYEPLEQFCKEHHLPILARIPYDVQIAGMTAVNSVANPGHRPGFLPTFLADNGAEVIISGGMGGGAVDIFNERGVEVIVGVSGEANAAVETYLCGELVSTGSICHKHEHADECGGHH